MDKIGTVTKLLYSLMECIYMQCTEFKNVNNGLKLGLEVQLLKVLGLPF